MIVLLLRVMSLSERPFLYDIMSGFLKIWFSNGFCCIRYHFLELLRISLDVELLGVTKGKVHLCLQNEDRRPKNEDSKTKT